MRAVMSIAISLVMAMTVGCSKSEDPPTGTKVAAAAPAAVAVTKDPATARTWLQQGAVVIDVRTPGEFAGGHLPNAINIPIDELPGRLAEVDKLVGGDRTRRVVAYCASGNRSKGAVRTLAGAGYTQVINGGGLDDLQ